MAFQLDAGGDLEFNGVFQGKHMLLSGCVSNWGPLRWMAMVVSKRSKAISRNTQASTLP